VGGNYGHREIGVVLIDGLHQFDAITIRQAHVGKVEVEPLAGQQSPGGVQILRRS
jgi:hypothetical protein